MKNSTSPLSPEAIASRAYQLWEAAGRPEGRDQDYWLLAEQELQLSAVANKRPRSQSARQKQGA